MSIKRTYIVAVVALVLLAGVSSAYAIANDARGTAKSAPLAKDPRAVSAATASANADEAQAEAMLARLQAKYRLLDGVTVRIGKTPAGEQAIAYYEEGEIVVSPERSATIQRILAHEIWHVIDYRDNGRLDWGEDLPPADASDYLLARP